MYSHSTLLSVCFLVLFSISLSAQQGPNAWTFIDEAELHNRQLERSIVPLAYQTLHLNLEDLKQSLEQAPRRFSAGSQQALVLSIPMPDGQMAAFDILEAPIMHPDLASKYPMLRSFVGIGVDDPTATARFDYTQHGFHGMILSGQHAGVYIDPYAKGDTEHYICYYQKDYRKETHFVCHAPDTPERGPAIELSPEKEVQGDCMLRTYRLALACTGEYGAYHGGTVPDVMAAFHTTMTRVNGIFERDMAINLEMIANTDALIYLDGPSDPYPFEFPSGNQAICDDIIGTENYDIGHVFGVGDGGSAERSSCCVEGLKAEGYSTITDPVGDGFDINFVAHEFGHQFGCSHTANGNCNNTPSTSVETGSAYSVMGFDFFCDPFVADVRGAFFHAVNIHEMTLNVLEGPPGSCAEITDPGNNPPSVDGGGEHYLLPISTPFKLTAAGTDLDGDALTYAWEQMDNERVTDPPVPTNPAGPAFRTYEPVEEPYRYYPSLEYLVTGTDYLWESLPSVSRVMNFRVTARDNAVGGGCTAIDDVDLTFTASAGPFLVNEPSGGEPWFQEGQYTVAWEVANTNQAPVSCMEVDILLSTDGGFTYPIILAENVPNDGAEVVVAPSVNTTSARVMVVCSDNIFFNISKENFVIASASGPSFSLAIDPVNQDFCGTEEEGTYAVTVSPLAGFTGDVFLEATGVPAGAAVDFSQNPIPTTGMAEVQISGLENVLAGSYSISISANSGNLSQSKPFNLSVEQVLDNTITLISPANGANLDLLRPSFEWEDEANEGYYFFELATDPTFENGLLEANTVLGTNYTLGEELEPLTVYYWRVIPLSACANELKDIPFFAFRTEGAVCRTYTNREPAFIPGYLATTTTSILIEDNFELVDVNLDMELFHKYVGDLKANLIAPDGTTVALFDRPGYPQSPGCTRDDLLVRFDDEASNTATEFENTCITGTDYAIEGTYQPIDPLAGLSGLSSQGEWVLTVTDDKFSHAGVVDSWSLEFCLEELAGALPTFSNNSLNVLELATEEVSANNLLCSSTTATAEQITYTLTSLPTAGTLNVSGSIAEIGTTFTQADINAGLLSYTHTELGALTDQVGFNIVTFDGNWIPNETLDINIGVMSTEDLSMDLDFVLAPNPASEEITLTLSQATAGDIEIRLLDVTGRVLEAVRRSTTGLYFQHTFGVQELPAGVYFVYLTDGVSTGRRIFMVQ